MDPEIAFIELGQDGDGDESAFNSTSLFQTNLEQRIGMIGSGVVLALSLVAIILLVFKIRRKDQQRMSSTTGSRLVASGGRGMFDKNIEMQAEFPYSNLNNDE